MERATSVAPEDLLERRHAIAQQEELPLAEVIRQGLEWRGTAWQEDSIYRRWTANRSAIGYRATGREGRFQIQSFALR